MEIHLRKLGTDNLKDTFTYKFRRINDIAFSYCCMIQESLLNSSRLKCEAVMSITRLYTCFPRWKSTSSWHSFISMSGKVLWWYVFPFSICEISILLLLVHRVSWYSSYSLVNIGAAQHNSTLAFASRSGLCHSQRLGYPWELRGSTQRQPASLPPELVLVQVSNPAVSHKRQHQEWSQYPQIRQTQSSVNSSSNDLQECRREAKQALDAVHSAVRCSWVITSPRLCLSCLSS